jgi:MFS family permease
MTTSTNPVPRTLPAVAADTVAADTVAADTAAADTVAADTAGAFWGALVDNFDIYLPVVVLAPAATYFQSPHMTPATAALVSSWIFAATQIGRPLGAVVFGWVADVAGRRRSTIIGVTGFAIATIAIALLPGYSTWGTGSIVALIALRFVDGVFLGGQYSGTTPLAMESVAPHARGRVGGLIQSGGAFAWVVIGALTLVMLHVTPAGGPQSEYARWGWRVPFGIGAVAALALAWYVHRHVVESDAWERAERTKVPVTSLLRGANLRGLVQVFVLMTGLWLTLDCVTAMLPPLLAGVGGLDSTHTTSTLMIMFAVMGVVFIAGGAVSQRTGRRRYFRTAIVVAATVGIGSYAALIASGDSSYPLTVCLTVLAGCALVCPWAAVMSYVNERFSTDARGTGFGLGYSVAIVLPAFYASYQRWLDHLMDARYTVLVLAAIGCGLAYVGATIGPETKQADLTRV